ncbi:uncharacterized protein LOC141688931 isoform X2 [Apium graveolens]|uniref:uncharacterized protein LOC141688931 isoform X2 n=1 Tax=Apium graveolens TaxID=4045 RepID=UPI003D797238
MPKDMAGFGYFGNGGFPSSSSSNLSPLAPPFTVDRSNSKANLNSLSNFTETSQPYGVTFSSSLHNWQFSHSSSQGTDYISHCGSENDSLRTTSVPSANDFSYLGSELVNSPTVHWAPPNRNTTDPASNQFSCGGATKRYYAPYVSQAIDDNVSLPGLNEVNYDLLSTSGLVPIVGTSQVDYSQGLSSLEFPPQWGGYWNGLSHGKRGKRTDITGSFHLEGTDLPGSHAYQDYLKHVPVEYSGLEGNPTATQSKHSDNHGREMNAGFLAKEQLYNNLGQNLGFSRTESSKAHSFGASKTSSHLESPSLEPVTFSSNCHNSYSAYEKAFQLFDSCINDCISGTKTSVMPKIRPPIVGIKYPVLDTVASKSMDIGESDLNRKDGSNYNREVEKEPLLPQSSGLGFLDANHLGVHTSRNDQCIFTASSSSNEDMFAKSICENSVDHVINIRGGQIPDINVPHGLTLSFEKTEALKHTANTTETSDQHNPAEDSPCWKGAPASSVSSPFESSEAILPHNLMMKLEACNSYDSEMTQMFPHNECGMGFSGEIGGPTYLKESLSTDNNKFNPIKTLDAILPTKEHSVANPARLKSDSMQQIRSDRDLNLSDIENQIKQSNLLNVSKSDSGSIQSQTELLCPKVVSFTCKSKIQLQAGDVDARISNSDTSADGCIPLHTVENVLCSPPSENDDGKTPAMVSNPIINVQTLANALHNISELLVLYNFGDEWGLKEQCSKTLEHAIHNINLCLSKKILQAPRQDLLFSKADISHRAKEGATKTRLHAMDEVGNTTVSQLNSYPRHEQKRIHGVSDTNFEKNMDCISSVNEADAAWHDNMVQNIKFVFDENFQSEEDISPETLLYKNLWLNAEAELCVTGLKARFDKVKIEMENCKSYKKKEGALVVESKPSCIVPPNTILNGASGLTPKANDSPKQKEQIECSRISSLSDAKDFEASVMARFQILKWRGDNVNACNAEEKSLPHIVHADVTDLAFPCKIVGSQTVNKTFDVAVGSRVRRHNDHNSEKKIGLSTDCCQHDAVEESSAYVSDDPTSKQPFRKIRMHNQPESGLGWYENTSSDWQHAQKEDSAWQK